MAGDEDVWERVKRLEAENAELKAELRACHDMLDGAGVTNEESTHRMTTGDDSVNLNLPARLQRFILSQLGCPMRRIR
jgi:hypothetical protein